MAQEPFSEPIYRPSPHDILRSLLHFCNTHEGSPGAHMPLPECRFQVDGLAAVRMSALRRQGFGIQSRFRRAKTVECPCFRAALKCGRMLALPGGRMPTLPDDRWQRFQLAENLQRKAPVRVARAVFKFQFVSSSSESTGLLILYHDSRLRNLRSTISHQKSPRTRRDSPGSS